MQSQNLKNLFNFMKQMGFYQEYKTYEEFRKAKWGEKIKGEIQEVKKEIDEFRETLSEKEKQDYDFVFGSSQPLFKGRRHINNTNKKNGKK